jgi:hypothetical protein
MKIIPLSESQQKLIAGILTDKRFAEQREKDFAICLLGSNGVEQYKVKEMQVSHDGKAVMVEFKEENMES